MRTITMKNFILELNCGTNVANRVDAVLTADVMEAINYLAAGTEFLSDKIFLDDNENTVYLRFSWPSIACDNASLKSLADGLCVLLDQAAIPLRCLDNGLQVMGVCDANKPSVWREEWEQFNIEFFQVPLNIDLKVA